MKIMIVTPYFTPKVGGLEYYALAVAKGLQEKGHEIVVVTSNHQARREDETSIDGIRVISLPIMIKLSNTPINPFWYFRLKKIIKNERPAVINTHSPVPFMADMATLAAGNIPVVATYHAGSMLKGNGGLVDAILRTYEDHILPGVFKKAKVVAAVLPAFVERKVHDTRKIQFVPPGVDTDIFTPNPNVDKSVDVIFVGRIERSSDWKGLDVLIRALTELKRSFPGIRVQIIGDGDAVDDYKELVEKYDLKNNVTFISNLTGVQLVPYYQRALILVLPSKTESESFGTVLAEAMSCEVVAIGSNIGGIPNVIDHGVNGLLFEPGDHLSLYSVIESILEGKQDVKRLTTNARDTVVKKFSKHKLIESMDGIIHSAVTPNVVHVTAKYPPSLGGLENVVEQLSLAQSDIGTPNHVVTSNLGYEKHYADSNSVKRIKAIEVAGLPIIFNLLFTLMREQRGSIFHVHVAQAFIPEVSWLAAKIRKAKLVCHFHLDVAPSGRFGWIFYLYKKYIFPLTLRVSDKVIVFSEEQKALVSRKYGVDKHRIIVIPNGVSQAFFHRPRTLGHREVKRVLYVGRLSPQKNISQLLGAAKELGDGFSIRIVGDGELKNALMERGSELGLNNVEFVGRMNGDRLIQEYNKADIFVITSEREGMPLVVLEAMAAGLPIVGTDVLGNDTLIENRGLLVQLNDSHGLAQAIIKLAHDSSLYRELSSKSYGYAMLHSWPLVAEATSQIYRELRARAQP